jgi:hypothetical protein
MKKEHERELWLKGGVEFDEHGMRVPLREYLMRLSLQKSVNRGLLRRRKVLVKGVSAVVFVCLFVLMAMCVQATVLRVANLTTNVVTCGGLSFPPGISVVDEASIPPGVEVVGVPVDYTNDLSVFISARTTNVVEYPAPLSQSMNGFVVGLVIGGAAFGLWACVAGLRLNPPGA